MTWWGALGLALSLYGAVVVLEWVYARVLQPAGVEALSVSIVLHVMNQEHLIEQAVIDLTGLWRLEMWDQKNVELIIADGGSTDQTVAILDRLQRQYPWLLIADSGRDKSHVLELCRHDVVIWVEMTGRSPASPLVTVRSLLAHQPAHLSGVIG
ncbi:MAG: glycosyltransferase [Sulfobacillus thermotolerans]|uniref:Glycosyltransferase 2-like domain-containing protein n=1 Tax=Sulfobacillus thermotolerans TaxID=338644 RepID=A0ABN5H2S4_9FIRM|nr:hypothetical protein BXT84_12945 [Sulfobacillus thermotolerans]MCY0908028.1 glycosyltransferase [Sulfobacillus thermotolerans]